MNTGPIDDRAEFLEWAQHRSEKIACLYFSKETHFDIRSPIAEQLKLRLAIRDALLEVFDRMAAGE